MYKNSEKSPAQRRQPTEGAVTAPGRRASGKARTRAKDPTEAGGGKFPIVGIGMSAGGLEVATTFLNAMPADSGIGFIIVQHLDPTRESMLAELLGRETRMSVVQIQEGMRVIPNRVHVIVPAKTLLIRDGILRLVEPEEPRGQRHPIDRFFSSLAEDQREMAIAIILSGAGSNGAAGLQDIKQAGGMCIAQDPTTARFDSMPRHAIASEAIDFVLAPEKMPDTLLRYIQHSYIHSPKPSTIADNSKAVLDDVLAFLREREGHDFSQYKRNTLSRRIRRRMSLKQKERLDDYLALLRTNAEEVSALVRDLMINVTAFFRDAEAWDALDKDVITPIVSKARHNQSIRVWVPACSTGEEAFTIAMLLAERGEALDKELTVKIFATDAAEHHLGAARRATFPGSMVESLSPERLSRFFEKGEDDSYRVKSAIRETVLFAPQNLLQDPPYSKMDLVSCRNLLIYLEPEAQERVLSLAHFALREDGYLFLGNAETVGQRDHLFETVSKRWRIYKRVGQARSGAIDFGAWPTRDRQSAQLPTQPKLADIAIKSLAEHYAPASVLIDRNYRVLHFHGRTEEFLAQPPGAPTLDLLTLARDGLRLILRSTVRNVIDSGQAVTAHANLKQSGKNSPVLIAAASVAGGMILVSFIRDKYMAAAPPALTIIAKPLEQHSDRDFEEELRVAREEMRSTVEQFEVTNEELTAANEEITSVNEELQATNEEMEASKEELQALNEELSTVNGQLDRKVIELEEASDDLTNLLKGNDVATIFIDTEMRIKWFSPAIQSLLNLIDKDVGRSIANFSQKFSGASLLEMAKATVEQLTTFEVEIRADNEKQYQLRVLPYRTRDNRIAGASATFIDITDLKSTEAETQTARDFAEAIVATVRDPLLVLSADFRVKSANPAFYRRFETSSHETTGRLVYELNGGIWNIPKFREVLEEMLPERQQLDNFEVEISIDGSPLRYFQLNARRILGATGASELILLSIEDVTERKNVALHQKMLLGELSHRVKNTLTVVQAIATQTLRHSTSLNVFSEAFQGRLGALARANEAVINGNWRGVRLREIAERSLTPFTTGNQVVFEDGPIVDLSPQASLALAMILHELATNAVKYGALATKAGQVRVAWRAHPIGQEPGIALDWTESGGPSVPLPARHGQGLKFIERSVAYELRGEASVKFAPEGLRVLLTFPLTTATLADGKRVDQTGILT